MNYKKVYDDLMISRLLMKQERYNERKNGKYFEGHHILPKCKGGEGNSSKGLNNKNIVLLTAREHFLAHWLLWRIYKDRQMALAFHKMTSSNKKQNRIISSRAYEECRIAFSETNKGNTYGKGVFKIISKKQKRQISEKLKGKYVGNMNSFFNKKHTEFSKKLMSNKAKDRFSNIENSHNYKGNRLIYKKEILMFVCKSNKEVSDIIGATESNIRAVLAGNQKTCKGYTIKYEK